MGLHREGTGTPETLTEQDIENKFTQLSLAFKTDKLTLENRVGIQQRQRDDAERNVAREILELRTKINRLQRLCQEPETIEELSHVQRQVEVLQLSTDSISRAAEMYGAVQQEDRVARAVDVILAHVDNLRRTRSKEHAELEEAKRLLQEATNESNEDIVPARGARPRSQQLQNVQEAARIRQPVRALQHQESVGRRTSLNAQRLDSTDSSEVVLRRNETQQSSVDSVDLSQAGSELCVASQLDILGRDDELDLSGSDDELQDDLTWNTQLRHRHSNAASHLDTGLVTQSGNNHNLSLRQTVQALWRSILSLRWPWTVQQTVWMLRRGATVILLVLAALTLLFIIVPVRALNPNFRIICWNPLRIEVLQDSENPYIDFRNVREPPPT